MTQVVCRQSWNLHAKSSLEQRSWNVVITYISHRVQLTRCTSAMFSMFLLKGHHRGWPCVGILNISKLAFRIAFIQKTKYFCHFDKEPSMWALFNYLYLTWFLVVHIWHEDDTWYKEIGLPKCSNHSHCSMFNIEGNCGRSMWMLKENGVLILELLQLHYDFDLENQNHNLCDSQLLTKWNRR